MLLLLACAPTTLDTALSSDETSALLTDHQDDLQHANLYGTTQDAPRLSVAPGKVRLDGLTIDATAWGRSGRLRSLPEVAAEGDWGADAQAGGAALRFVGGGLEEWWRGAGRAAQQGFTLLERPAGTGEVEIEVRTGAAPILQADGGLNLRWEGRIYRVAGLAAWDADGRRLPARFEAGGQPGEESGEGSGGFRILVDDAGARWPITVDPYYSVIAATLENPFGAGGYLTLESGDTNGDGYSDLIRTARDGSGITPKWIFTSFGGPIGLLYQYGAGFNYDTTIMGGYITWGDDLAIGDFNGDGFDDAAVSEDYALQFNVYDGSASGLTALSSTIGYSASYRFSERLRAADFDGDGYDDLLAIGRDYLDPTHLLIFPGGPSGLSATPNWLGYSGVSGGVEEPYIGDVNGDGAPDAVIFEAGTKQLYVFEGPIFGAVPDQTLTSTAWGLWAFLDLDGDGDDDGVTAWTVGGDVTVSVYAGSAGGMSSAPVDTVVSSYDEHCVYPGDAGDLDGDGDHELLLSCYPQSSAYAGSLRVYDGGSLSLGAPASVVTGSATEIWYEPQRVEDFDGDGQGDYAVMAYDSATLTNKIHLFFAPFDRDGDGYDDQSDCNDGDAQTNPGAAELCDGQDNDCDGLVDEGATVTLYADADNDGYGDPNTSINDCAGYPGYVVDGTDCDDSSAWISPGGAEYCDGLDNDCNGQVDEAGGGNWFTDADGDGYGAGSPIVDCNQPTGTVGIDGDCDDGDGSISPAGVEVCDGLDNDCNGQIDDGQPVLSWYADADSDGYGDPSVGAFGCVAPTGYVADATDCDDADGSISPAGVEVCDGADQDCDGAADNGLSTQAWYADGDGDSYGDAAQSTVSCGAPTGYVGDGTDCDDGDATVSPGASEVCDGADQDCDGTADDGLPVLTWFNDGDGDGFGAGSALTGCAQPTGTATADGDCDDGDAAVNPGASEVPFNGVDDDCSGGGCSSAGGEAGLSLAVIAALAMSGRRRGRTAE